MSATSSGDPGFHTRLGEPVASAAATGAAAIELDDVSVRYGKTAALDRVTLSIPTGSVYALLGRNGAGKSSAVRCLLGQQKPTRGRIRLLGADVWKKRASLMERVGVVPEEPDMPPAMTAPEIAAFCARLYPRWDDAGFARRLERFRVPAATRFGSLSRGQKAQVALALALAPSPELLVLDDPTLGLDVVARRDFFEEVIGELADRGMTVLITTHDLPGVERIADRVGILREGRLVVDETLEDLKARYRRLRDARGTEVVTDCWSGPSLERLRVERGLADVEVLPLTLEEIFTELLGESRPAAGARGVVS